MDLRTKRIRAQIISNGVKNLKDYGYPSCNEENILTDTIFKAFFLSMLKDNKGKMGKEVDDILDSLIEEVSDNGQN